MEKNELMFYQTEKQVLQDIVCASFQHKQCEKDKVSLYDLFEFHRNVKHNIESKREDLWNIIKSSLEERIGEINTINYKVHNQSFIVHFYTTIPDIPVEYQLEYQRFNNEIFLAKGPSNFYSIIYKIHELLMTEFYESFEKLFHLCELHQKYSDEIYLLSDGFNIHLDARNLRITKEYPKKTLYSLSDNTVFFLIYGFSKGQIRTQFFSSFRDIMLLLKDQEEDFLKGFYINKSMLSADTILLLDEYLKIKDEYLNIKPGVSIQKNKQKSIFDRFKNMFHG